MIDTAQAGHRSQLTNRSYSVEVALVQKQHGRENSNQGLAQVVKVSHVHVYATVSSTTGAVWPSGDSAGLPAAGYHIFNSLQLRHTSSTS